MLVSKKKYEYLLRQQEEYKLSSQSGGASKDEDKEKHLSSKHGITEQITTNDDVGNVIASQNKMISEANEDIKVSENPEEHTPRLYVEQPLSKMDFMRHRNYGEK